MSHVLRSWVGSGFECWIESIKCPFSGRPNFEIICRSYLTKPDLRGPSPLRQKKQDNGKLCLKTILANMSCSWFKIQAKFRTSKKLYKKTLKNNYVEKENFVWESQYYFLPMSCKQKKTLGSILILPSPAKKTVEDFALKLILSVCLTDFLRFRQNLKPQ